METSCNRPDSITSAVGALTGVAMGTVTVERFSTELFEDVSDLNRHIFSEAVRQSSLGYTFRGLALVCSASGWLLSGASQWVSNVEKIRETNQYQCEVLKEIDGILLENEISYLLCKGQRVAMLYDEPELRQCGDIDLYFETPRQAHRALIAILKFLEYDSIDMQARSFLRPDGSYVFYYRYALVELHPSLPSGIPSIGALDSHPETGLLAAALHILRHASTYGIGLRQLWDLAMECRAFTSGIDGDSRIRYFEKLLKEHGVGKWWSLLESFLNHFLYVPSVWLPFKGNHYVNPGPLFKIVCEGGNFGHHGMGRSIWKPVKNYVSLSRVAPVNTTKIYFDILTDKCKFI